MMESKLLGSEIHGFQSMKDLDIENVMEEAKTRWLRPNEIHVIISNYKRFSVNIKPVNLPKSGTILLFDRKILRNFRKDGHNWKKKKDGKTVKEAHEHLKVGNAERIHVYYAHGQDSPTFVRRCYWLLDKKLEHIVLVHYRETHELQGSPVTSVNSNSFLSASDQSATQLPSEELNSVNGHGYYAESGDSLTIQNHEMRLHEINTLEWDDLVANDPGSRDKALHMDQNNQLDRNFATMNFDISDVHYSQTTVAQANANGQAKYVVNGDRLQNQDSVGKWISYIAADSPVSVDDAVPESSISSAHNSSTCPPAQQLAFPEQLFVITDISPAWAFSNEATKVLVTGYYQEQYLYQAKSNLLCVCGEDLFPLEFVQTGVYRCFASASSPGIVNLYLSLDGYKPISQVLNFEYRNRPLPNPVAHFEDRSKCEELQFQLRLAHLLFSSRKKLDIINSGVPPTYLAEAKKISHRTSHISDGCAFLMELVKGNRISYAEVKDSLLEITLKNVLKEWLLEKVVDGRQTTEYDAQGLGVIHLCAILGYTWAVPLYLWSGLSLNFRDKHGWAALHWAAYYGREKMVAALLSAGANAAIVTDPTSKRPGGCSPADLAAENGYDGLAAYLSEKALVGHFEAMSIAGNVSGSLESNVTDSDPVISVNQSEEQILKSTLTAYRTAADAAAQIQGAFRERSLKVRTKAIQLENPETEARNIAAAMKIQHAFRYYEGHKKMAAAADIQYRFRTWKMRKEFLNMRRHAIKIQTAFRGLLARKQYHKFVWSVGVLEKAVLRWRLKRKGFRGFHVDEVENHNMEDVEEDFYVASRKQAEERIERSVIRVQALFRSKIAQQEYRRMKLAHNKAKLEYEELIDSTNDIAR